jgi:hypothetical protein
MGLLTISLVVRGAAPLRAAGKRSSGEGNRKTQCNDHRNETFHASPPNGLLYKNAHSTFNLKQSKEFHRRLIEADPPTVEK